MITNYKADISFSFTVPLKHHLYGIWNVFCEEDSHAKDFIYCSNASDTSEISGIIISPRELTIKTQIYAAHSIFYYQDDEDIFISNDLRLLLQFDIIPFVVNKRACAKFLSWRAQVEDGIAMENESFFEGIFRIGENKVFHYSDGVIHIVDRLDIRSWLRRESPSEGSVRNILGETLSQYSASKRVAIELSGGIDSACVLAELLQSGFKPDQIFAFIMSFHDNDLADTNDLNIAKELVEYFGINGYVVYGDKSLRLPDYNNMKICNINGPVVSANYLWLQTINHMCTEMGIRHIFTGNGGDELLGGSPYVYDYDFYTHPIETVKRLKNDFGNRALKVAYPLLLKPVLFPWKYYSTLWGELKTPIPSYFSLKHRKLEKQERQSCRKMYNNSSGLTGWGRRFLFDFSVHRPDYFEDWFDNTEFENPFYSEKMLLFSHQLKPEELFDVSKNGYYSGSKRKLREDYAGLLPESLLRKEIKTTYNQMSKKMFYHSFPKIHELLSGRESLLSQMGLVDQEQFMDELIRCFLTSEDKTAQFGVSFRYIWAAIELELWLIFISEGREKVLQKSLQSNAEPFLCEAVRI